ncbi:protein FAM219A-like isoform X2 [Actinia tenebrosa]|uniref:Protein FAM219A-like isoform X2 n=1 Tax=Actinia tenebrosa TaxID=6105 RepID=A0A6P8I725_ACTTE|nr:protein FAM219A-like isoform X2 [Actinia tenebrosa]
MSKAAYNGASYVKTNGFSNNEEILKQDVQKQKIQTSPLHIKLEQLQKARKSNGKNGVITSQPNGHGIARYKNNKTRRHRSDHRPLFSMDSDSDEELTITKYNSKSPNVSITQNSKELAECEERLLKDGYRLDEMSDEEDLDLIPPRHLDNRCCSTVSHSCTIS